MNSPAITVEALRVSRGGTLVLPGISLDVNAGLVTGLLGPSGSGKTTTVRMLTGTLGRTRGEIRVLGEEPMRFSRRTRSRIAYMPQLFSLYEDLSAEENVGFVAALYGIGPFVRGKLIRRALEVAGNNRTRAAEMLGLSVRTLRNKLNGPGAILKT